MSDPYRFDVRAGQDILDEIRDEATRRAVPGVPDANWGHLFDGANDDPSRLLLEAVTEQHPTTAAHLDVLAATAQYAWMHGRLGIELLPPQPSKAFVVAESDPSLTPVVVPADTELRGPKADGQALMYRTLDTVVASGASVLDVVGYAVDKDRDGTAHRGDSTEPFEPFPRDATSTHAMHLTSPVLRFSGGTMRVRVDFGVTLPPGVVDLAWAQSTTDGMVAITDKAQRATYVDLTMQDRCEPIELFGHSGCHLSASFPTDAGTGAPIYMAGLTDLQLGRVKVSVIERTGVAPDAGMYNDGLLDLTKEFKPFGDVPRRGDSFYIQSDEAMAKNLASLTIRLDVLDEAEAEISEAFMYPATFRDRYGGWLSIDPEFAAQFIVLGWLGGDDGGRSDPTIRWQFYDGDEWAGHRFPSSSSLRNNSTTSAPGRTTQTEVAGVGGHFLRLFLERGDFGWEQHLADIATFAAQAAGTNPPDATLLEPPKPPQLSRVRLSYTTRAETVERVVVQTGPARFVYPGDAGGIRPFDDPLSATTFPKGAVFFGLDTVHPATATTVLIAIDPASACTGRTGTTDAEWTYYSTAGEWHPLPVADGTDALRTTGVVRFIAPEDWSDGCPDVDHPDGYWLRFLTSRDDLVGRIEAVLPDATTAQHDAGADVAAPAAKELKGPTRHIAGIKKLTNPLAGAPGRSIERREDYLRRAPEVVRHRNRDLQPWDYERRVLTGFSEIAAVRCLPHSDGSGQIVPGAVALIIIPRDSTPEPAPSAELLARVEAAFENRGPLHARVHAMCPEYVQTTIAARVILAPGVAALDARSLLIQTVDDDLRPTMHSLERLGQPLYPSRLVALLERSPIVDRLDSFEVTAPTEAPIRPDPERGLVVSSGAHLFDLVEQL